MSDNPASGKTKMVANGVAPLQGINVLQLIARVDDSGCARIALDLAQMANEGGGKAMVVHDGGSAYALGRFKIPAASLRIASRNPLVAYNVARRLCDIVEERAIDVIHAQSATLAGVALRAVEKTGCKLLTTFNDGPGAAIQLTRRTRLALAHSHRVITLSAASASRLAEALPSLANRIEVIPYGVDLTRFDPQRVTPERVIQTALQWQIPDGVPIVMLPAQFVRMKGHIQLLDALTLLRDVDLRCIMLGPEPDGGAFRKSLEREIALRQLTDRVLVANETRDMPAALMLADVVAAPYLKPATYNRVICEAQALGRPVVASDFPAVRELLVGNPMAWPVEAGDTAALALALRGALTLGAEERENRSGQVIAHLRQRSDRSVMHAAFADLYAGIARDIQRKKTAAA